MQRRQLLQAATATMFAAVAAPRAQAATRPKPKIIMVHGSWHWGGCFQKVADRLALAGYPVVTPDLTSHGYNSAAYDSFTSIEDYAEPVEATLTTDVQQPLQSGQRESPQLPNVTPGLTGVLSLSTLNAKVNPARISFTGCPLVSA
jgi:dienelactone hydrolase